MKYILKKKPEMMAVDENLAGALSKDLGISLFLARLLCARGVLTLAEAKEFLNPDKAQLHDPFLFTDMKDAVSMVKNAAAQQRKICIYGDYDADGVSASAILFRTLKKMDVCPVVFLPAREEHGYGLSMAAVESLQGTELLITVDCGITNVEEVAYAKSLGMHVIITDHHECPAILPKADFILNPKRLGENYPYKHLCGAGVAFKLACALVGEDAFELIDIAALATIADIVPLLGENRVIAKLGLAKMNADPNAGILELYKKTGIRREKIDAQAVSFSLAPRINAAGRMASAEIAFDLLVEENKAELSRLADELCALNSLRQKRQEEIYTDALTLRQEEEDKIILLHKEEWDVGIVGLAASKLTEKYGKPAILLGETGGVYVGSARSIGGVDIYDALNTQAHLFEKFGGHSGAAGFTIKKENLGMLKDRLSIYLDQKYPDEIFLPVRQYDEELKIGGVTKQLIGEVELLRPFGHKNEKPNILLKNADIYNIVPIGEGKHVRFMLGKYNGASLNGVAFSVRAEDVPKKADVIGSVLINDFDGKPQMIVDVFSFEEAPYIQYAKAVRYLGQLAEVTKDDYALYYAGREEIGEVYSLFAAACEKNMRFDDMGALIAFFNKHLAWVSIPKLAFAVQALTDIGLLEIKKGDKITIVTKNEKRELAKSRIYALFLGSEYGP